MKQPKQPTYSRTTIRQWRKHKGLTLEQLGGAIDMTESHLSMLERGERGYTQETLERIAAALNVEPSKLLGRLPGPKDELAEIVEGMTTQKDRLRAAKILKAMADD